MPDIATLTDLGADQEDQRKLLRLLPNMGPVQAGPSPAAPGLQPPPVAPVQSSPGKLYSAPSPSPAAPTVQPVQPLGPRPANLSEQERAAMRPKGFWRNLAGIGSSLAAGFAGPGQAGKAYETFEHGKENRAVGAREKEQESYDTEYQQRHQAEVEQREKGTAESQAANLKSEAEHRKAQDAVANQRIAASLAQHGLKLVTDENGASSIAPVPENELPPELRMRNEQLKNLDELRIAQTELARARAELAHAQNDPNSPQYKLALMRAQTAQANVGRAQAMLMNAFANTLGTTPTGEPLPGGPVDVNGNPIGLGVYRETGPTGQQRNRGQFARDAINYLDENVIPHIDQLAKSGDLGPAVGRFKEIISKYGLNDDPQFMGYLTNKELMKGAIASIHFGGRGIAEQFQAGLDYLLSPRQPADVIKANASEFRKLLVEYARAGGRSVTQRPFKGEVQPGGGRNQEKKASSKDFGPAPAGAQEGRTGKLPDGTRVVVKGGRLVAQ